MNQICSHFQDCGGCRTQDLAYTEQLQQKESYIQALFNPILNEQVQFLPMLAAENPWHYRNKMEFSFSQSKNGEQFLGLFSKVYKRSVVNIHQCDLSPLWFSEMLGAIRKWWQDAQIPAYHCHSNRGTLRHVCLREGKNSGDRMVVLTVSGHPDFQMTIEQLNHFTDRVNDAFYASRRSLTHIGHETIVIRTQHIAPKVPTYFEEKIMQGRGYIHEILKNASGANISFKVNASAFFQPNSLQAEKLYQQALALGDLSIDDEVLDLYCGTGTLGIFTASKVKFVMGIELNQDAAVNARENCQINNITNVEIINDDVGRGLAQLQLSNRLSSIKAIILDPPRSGLMPEAIQTISNLPFKKIIYISCNPETQIRDIHSLLAAGYQLKMLQPVDQFPHTPHVENIAILERYT